MRTVAIDAVSYFLRCLRLHRWASQLNQEVSLLGGSKYSGDCLYCTTNFVYGKYAKLGEEKPLLLLRGQLLFGEDTYAYPMPLAAS